MPGLRSAALSSECKGDGVPAPPKPAGNAVMPDNSSDPFDQVLIPRKGLGMVATQDIERGTRILSEEPILLVGPDENTDKHLLQKFLDLSPTQHGQLTELSGPKQRIDPKAYATFVGELRKYRQYSGRYLEAAAVDFAKMHAIYCANAVMLGPEARFGIGIFPVYSRLNHSCTPNVQHSYNATTGREVVHAIRDIRKGEEIVTSYVSLQQPAETRIQELFRKWGFKCSCKTCCETVYGPSENRRRQLYEIDQGIALFERPIDRKLSTIPFPEFIVPTTDEQTLRWAEQSVEVLKTEGLVGMDMAKAYRTCSKYSLREGHLEKAIGYARKELEVQVTCLGEDTAYLSPDDDAKVWLKHIENMSEADRVRLRMNEKRVQKAQKKEAKKAAKKASKF